MSEPVSNRRLTIQFICFWLIWLVVQVGLNAPIEKHLSGWPQELLLDAIKLVVWLGAAWWFIRQADYRHLRLSLSNAEQWRPNWRFAAGYVVWGIIVIYLLGEFWLVHHGLIVNHSFIPQFWGRYFLVVGVTEEFLFRGYFFNALLQKFSLTTANVIQALAFCEPAHPPLPDHGTRHEPHVVAQQPGLRFSFGVAVRLVVRTEPLTLARHRHAHDLGHPGHLIRLNKKFGQRIKPPAKLFCRDQH